MSHEAQTAPTQPEATANPEQPRPLEAVAEDILARLKDESTLATLQAIVRQAVHDLVSKGATKRTVLRVVASGLSSDAGYDSLYQAMVDGKLEIDTSVPVQVLPARDMVVAPTYSQSSPRTVTLAPQLIVGQVVYDSIITEALGDLERQLESLRIQWEDVRAMRNEVMDLRQALTAAQKETVAKVKEAATLTSELAAARAREQRLREEQASILENMKQLERRERLMRLDLGERRVHEIMNGEEA
jgi:hypothetical protein